MDIFTPKEELKVQKYLPSYSWSQFIWRYCHSRKCLVNLSQNLTLYVYAGLPYSPLQCFIILLFNEYSFIHSINLLDRRNRIIECEHSYLISLIIYLIASRYMSQNSSPQNPMLGPSIFITMIDNAIHNIGFSMKFQRLLKDYCINFPYYLLVPAQCRVNDGLPNR